MRGTPERSKLSKEPHRSRLMPVPHRRHPEQHQKDFGKGPRFQPQPSPGETEWTQRKRQKVEAQNSVLKHSQADWSSLDGGRVHTGQYVSKSTNTGQYWKRLYCIIFIVNKDVF